MAYKYQTVHSEAEAHFDEMLNELCSAVRNPEVTFCTTSTLYNEQVVVSFVAHVRYEAEEDAKHDET